MSEWKTIQYDGAGNVIGVVDGYVGVPKPRGECYFGMRAAPKTVSAEKARRRKEWPAKAAYQRRMQLEASERPVWSSAKGRRP